MSADFSMDMGNPPSLVESTQAGTDTSSTIIQDSSSSSLWIWAFVFVVIGFFMLVVYYYILYFYDATSLSDAIENAIKKFNKRDEDDSGSTGHTGSTGDYYYSDEEDEDEITFKKVLIKALDDSTTEGFSTYAADTSFGTIQKKGTLDWGFIEDSNPNCSIEESGQCMSGDIFPTRDICINPKLRSQ